MGLVDTLRGKVVGLDTAPLIYFTEDNPRYVKMVDSFFQAVKQGEFTVVTSLLTWLEVLVVPVRMNKIRLVEKYYELLFEIKGLDTVGISKEIVERAAELRAFHPKMRTPDAIQIATAIETNASYFFTNDAHLSNLPGIQVLVLDHLDP
jgi:predicted nucleic acid-binding protein